MKISLNEITPNKAGVYKITNQVNGKFYIGSSVTVRERLTKHILELNKNIHRNRHLQNAWNKYGEKNFEFNLLEYCEPERCLNIEQKYLNELLKADVYLNTGDRYFLENGYNISPAAQSPLGIKRNDEFKRKESEGQKRKWQRMKERGWEETREKMRKAKLNFKPNNTRKVLCLSLLTGVYTIYPSITSMEKDLGIKKGLATICLLKGRTKTRSHPNINFSYYED